jgi:hypothetical protein
MKYSIFFILILHGCMQNKQSNCAEQSIIDLVARLPELNPEKKYSLDYYKPIKTVIFDDNKNIKIQLWSPLEKVRGRMVGSRKNQKIVVISNNSNQCYSIPLLHNKYHDYWNFELDKPIENVNRVNTTFEKEFMQAMNQLSLGDSMATCQTILVEIFQSLLNTKHIDESSNPDDLKNRNENSFFSEIAKENSDSCQLRVYRNIEAIQKRLKSKGLLSKSAFWDRWGGRIYQVIDKKDTFDPSCNFSIKVYRQDCNYHFMDL